MTKLDHILWYVWEVVQEPVPLPTFIEKQANGQMKSSQGQVLELYVHIGLPSSKRSCSSRHVTINDN